MSLPMLETVANWGLIRPSANVFEARTELIAFALNPKGRAGFVMANSASEKEIRQKLIESRAVDMMVVVGPNTVVGKNARDPLRKYQ